MHGSIISASTGRGFHGAVAASRARARSGSASRARAAASGVIGATLSRRACPARPARRRERPARARPAARAQRRPSLRSLMRASPASDTSLTCVLWWLSRCSRSLPAIAIAEETPRRSTSRARRTPTRPAATRKRSPSTRRGLQAVPAPGRAVQHRRRLRAPEGLGEGRRLFPALPDRARHARAGRRRGRAADPPAARPRGQAATDGAAADGAAADGATATGRDDPARPRRGHRSADAATRAGGAAVARRRVVRRRRRRHAVGALPRARRLSVRRAPRDRRDRRRVRSQRLRGRRDGARRVLARDLVAVHPRWRDDRVREAGQLVDGRHEVPVRLRGRRRRAGVGKRGRVEIAAVLRFLQGGWDDSSTTSPGYINDSFTVGIDLGVALDIPTSLSAIGR